MKRIRMHDVVGSTSNIAKGSIIAKKVSRVGSVPGCIFLASADIGRARTGKKSVWISWGRNIPASKVDYLLKIGITPIWVGAQDGSVEVVIPDKIAEKLIGILISGDFMCRDARREPVSRRAQTETKNRSQTHNPAPVRIAGRKQGETMKITATSEFHGSLSTTFRGCVQGLNIRRLRGPRRKYCLDYSDENSHVCGCGYPVYLTSWDAGKFGVTNVAECGRDGDCYGRGYIRFDIYDAEARAAAAK